MLKHRLKIFLSIFLSLIIVQGITYFSDNPEVVSVQAGNIKGLLSGIKFNASSLTKLFTLNIDLSNNNDPNQWNDPNNSFGLPSISNAPSPTNLPVIEPTDSINFPTDIPVGPTSYVSPTKKPTNAPTATPKPTKPPKPTATPKPVPIDSDRRPGDSLNEIFDEVSKRTCFPTALLMAFKTVETGERFKNDNAKTIGIYNTYGWWKTGAGNPCYGFGYHTQTGIVPSDSVNAGTSCSSAVGNPTDIKIMGLLQISEWEEEVSRKHTIAHLPKSIDRRVLFDNSLIFAYITRARVGSPPKDCQNWPDDMVKLAAEKHHGVCVYDYGTGNAGNYCTQILELYKQFK